MTVSQLPSRYEVSASSDYFTTMILRNIHEPLLKDYKGEIRNNLVTNWYVSDNNKITIIIKDNIRFSDGSIMTTNDVVDTYNWMISYPNSIFHNAKLFNPSLFTSTFFNNSLDNKQFYEYNTTFIDSIVNLNNKMIEIYSHNHMTLTLFMATVGIMQSSAINKGVDYLNTNHSSLGVYSIYSTSDNNIVLKKNKYHELYKQNKSIPDIVEMVLEPDFDESYRLLTQNRIDFVQYLPLDFYEEVLSGKKYQVIEKESNVIVLLSLNATSESLPAIRARKVNNGSGSITILNPLRDNRVRKAIVHAIDIQGFIDKNLHSKARSIILPMLPDVYGYPPDLDWYEYDLEYSKSLMKESGYEEGFEMEIVTIEGIYSGPIAHFIQESLKNINIDIKIVITDFRSIVTLDTNSAANIRAYNFTQEHYTFLGVLFGRFYYSPTWSNPRNTYHNYSLRLNTHFHNFYGTDEYSNEYLSQCRDLTETVLDEATLISLVNPFDIYLLNKNFVYQPSSNRITLSDFKVKK